MKKLLLSLALVMACQMSFGKGLNDLVNQYKSKENVQCMMVPQSMVKMLVGQMMNSKSVADKMGEANASKEDINKIVDKIDSVMYLSMDDCTADVKSSFGDKIKGITDDGYTEMESMPGMGVVYSKEMNGVAKEVVVLITKGGDCDLVQFFGSLKPEEVKAIINRVSNLKM